MMHVMINTIVTEGWLAECRWLILEHDKRHDFTDHHHCAYYKEYGRTHVSIFTAEEGIEF